MSEVALLVNGNLYTNWKGVGIRRTIESMSGSFSLTVADHWLPRAVANWPIREWDECQVKIYGQTVSDGWVTRRSPAFTDKTQSLAYGGKDRSSALVKCSAFLSDWSFKNATVVDITKKLAAPHGISVKVQPGLELLKAPRRVAVSQGDTGFTVLAALAKASGVMIVSDGLGGILITRSGTERASEDLIEGVNLKAGGVDYDTDGRFGRYVVSTQIPSTDNAHGKAARVSAEAFDDGVRVDNQVLLIRPETGLTRDYARQRADWEARTRAARGASAFCVVHGWQQSDGQLWPLNVLTHVKSTILDLDEDMLISQAEHSIDDRGGEITTLRLVRPDAFAPEPKARVRA